MFSLTDGIGYVDLNFRDVPGMVATGILTGPDGVTLVDPGPTSCLDTLRRALAVQGIAPRDLRRILLTHIHLDHAGATGTLVQEHPDIEVYVHERGAKHLIDPAKLLDSAGRVFGSMSALWGSMLPVPADRLRVLHGGEQLRLGGRSFAVAYTPGHASHHVSYFDAVNGMAWVGDAAGVRVGRSGFVMPPTPPPDINLELWNQSLALIRAWRPALLFLTHFGPVEQVHEQLERIGSRLRETAEMVRRSLDSGSDPDGQFAAYREEYIRRFLSEPDASACETVAPMRHNWTGLARYWTKQKAAARA